MAIRGAIFDCDGTLLDSMPMWKNECVGLLMRHEVEDAERIFFERESLDMYGKCVWYHENLGIGASGDALYEELRERVVCAYRKSVLPFEGCRDFLEELSSAGIRMVIASSTPVDILREALKAHGLMGYFDHVVFAGDVGRDKEHPDVYIAAQDILGTDRESTWVFEDAPFGVRAAARAGFPVVALYNDHDGRDRQFLARWATYVACGYMTLDLGLLCTLQPHTLRALVVAASPEPSSAALVGMLARQSDYVIAADGGANILMDAGVEADVFCGDQDSAGTDACAWSEAHASKVVVFPREKDDTDLSLAVACAREEADRRGACLRLVVTCASGGRPDHMLGVLKVLARACDVAPRIMEDGYECRMLSVEGRNCWRNPAEVGSTISVFSMCGEACVSAYGMRWNLSREFLGPLEDRGVSNKVIQAESGVTCHNGTVAVFAIRGQD